MQYDDFGTLTVRVSEASGSIPIEGAVVRVTGGDEENREVDYSFLTDIDGRTSVIRLPSPALFYSESPGSAETPYANYNVEIAADGFYNKMFYNISVFPGINSNQNVNMIPSAIHLDGVTYPRDTLDTVIAENEVL